MSNRDLERFRPIYGQHLPKIDPMRLLLTTIFLSLISLTYAQSQSIITPAIQIRLDSIAVQDVPAGAPGIATGIIQNGNIVYEKVAGFANIKDKTPITRATRFNIASNGKQFTALAILVLEDEKKINLSDDIRKYLPALYPRINSRITIEHLLNHTSGIRDVYDLWSLKGLTWWKESFNNKDVVKLLENQQDLNFTPGTKYLYSNSNYILLAEIIERVTKETFVNYTNKLFGDLNMPNTSFEADYKKIRGPIAKAYFNFNTWTTYNWIWNVCGDGNIFSTLADQLQWEQILQGHGKCTVKQEILQRSQQLTTNSPFGNYGFGLEFGTYKGLNYRFHEGATGAWKATVIRFPDKQTSMITLTNTGKSTPDTQTRQMADLLFGLSRNANTGKLKPEKVGPFISDEEVIGIYQTESQFTFQFEKVDDIIYLKRSGRNDVKLEREADNIFHQLYDPNFKQEFIRNEKGELTVTAYHTSHSPYTLIKQVSDWSEFSPLALNGRYYNNEIDVWMEIKFTLNKSYSVKVGTEDGSNGICLSPTKILVDGYVLEFDNAIEPKNLYLSGGRVEKIKFTRK